MTPDPFESDTERAPLAVDEALAKSGSIPDTAIAKFDELAVKSTHWDRFVRGIEERGFRVKAKSLGPDNPARINVAKRQFQYDPRYMTRLDMLHEMIHFRQFKQAGNLRTGGGLLMRYEVEAYTFEKALGLRKGFSPEYMSYLDRQIEYYSGSRAYSN